MNKQPVGILGIFIKEGRLSGCFAVRFLKHEDMGIRGGIEYLYFPRIPVHVRILNNTMKKVAAGEHE